MTVSGSDGKMGSKILDQVTGRSYDISREPQSTTDGIETSGKAMNRAYAAKGWW